MCYKKSLKDLDIVTEITKRLVNKLQVHDKEMDLASRLQQTMLKADIPQFDSIQIGVISVAAQKVSGDYFNLIDHKDGTMSFAVADVIGSGIPSSFSYEYDKIWHGCLWTFTTT